MLLIKQYKAQVLQLMLIRPQTSRVMRAGLLEDIFDGVFSFGNCRKEGNFRLLARMPGLQR